MKPASLNKLIGKRNWKLEQIPKLDISDEVLENPPITKKKRVTRSESFREEITQNGTSTEETSRNGSSKCLSDAKGKIGEKQLISRSNHFHKELSVGKTDLDELPTAESIEGYLAYNLRKTKFFCRKMMNLFIFELTFVFLLKI